MGTLQALGQINQHAEQRRGVARSNRQKLRNFDYENELYLTEVMLDNNQWKNNVQVQDIEQDQLYQSMVEQWTQQDQQLDKIFAQGNQKVENAIIEMYENDYAGTQTGRTAARLAGKSAKKLGQAKAEIIYDMMLATEESELNKEILRNDADRKSRMAWEKIRFSPIHGPTPIAPELDPMPSSAGLVLGLLLTGLGTAVQAGAFKAPKTGLGGSVANTGSGATGGFGLGTYGAGMPSNPAYVGVGANTSFVANPMAYGGVGGQYAISPAQAFTPSAPLFDSGFLNTAAAANVDFSPLTSNMFGPPVSPAQPWTDPHLIGVGLAQ